ncbi:MAG: hypothetical protein ACLTDS_08645 [Bianqueaceae bacterium]
MHAGEAKNGSGQRAKCDKFVHATVETTMSAEKQNKNARRRGEEQQRPACKGGKFTAGTVEVTEPAEKQNKNARRYD